MASKESAELLERVDAFAATVDMLLEAVTELAERVDRVIGFARPVGPELHYVCACGQSFERLHGLNVHAGKATSGVHGWIGEPPSAEEIAAERARRHAQARAAAGESLELHTGKLPGTTVVGKT